MRDLIQHYYPQANVELVKIPGFSGCFEVFVDNTLVHSKKQGQGFIKDPQAFMLTVKKIVGQ